MYICIKSARSKNLFLRTTSNSNNSPDLLTEMWKLIDLLRSTIRSLGLDAPSFWSTGAAKQVSVEARSIGVLRSAADKETT